MAFLRDAIVLPHAHGLSQGSRHGCALDAGGIASCWGANDSGQLGAGKTSAFRDAAGAVVGLPPVAEIVASYDRTCARGGTGDVFCWGDRSWGKAGDGTLIDDGRASATKLAVGTPIVTGAVAIACGSSHSCVAFGNGTVSCWGNNLSGQSGSSHIHPPLSRPTVVPHAARVVALAAGELSTCSIDQVGGVRCWGGILGNPAITPVARYSDAHPAPRSIALPGPAAEVSVGSAHACARLADGRVFCWGEGERGQLGDGTTARRDAAGEVHLAAPATQLSSGTADTCALAAGRVFCWGQERLRAADGSITDALRPAEPAAPAP